MRRGRGWRIIRLLRKDSWSGRRLERMLIEVHCWWLGRRAHRFPLTHSFVKLGVGMKHDQIKTHAYSFSTQGALHRSKARKFDRWSTTTTTQQLALIWSTSNFKRGATLNVDVLISNVVHTLKLVHSQRESK